MDGKNAHYFLLKTATEREKQVFSYINLNNTTKHFIIAVEVCVYTEALKTYSDENRIFNMFS